MQNQEWQTVAQQLTLQMSDMQQQLAVLVKHQQYQAELFAEMTPILKEIMSAGTTQLQQLEEKGYFTFAKELTGIMEQVVTGFSAEDVKQLGQNIVAILNTVRSLTQPDVLQILNQVAEPIHHPDQVQSVGLYGMVKATRDDDVRRGFGVMLEVLRQIGRGVSQVKHRSNTNIENALVSNNKRDSIRAKLAPKRKEAESSGGSSPAVVRPGSGHTAPAETVSVNPNKQDGFDAEGYLLDPDRWTREMATQIAVSLQVPVLTDDHWKVLEFARTEFKETGKSPNIRRVTVGTGLDTKRIYQLFPQAPGRTIAKVAGIPKPGGCL